MRKIGKTWRPLGCTTDVTVRISLNLWATAQNTKGGFVLTLHILVFKAPQSSNPAGCSSQPRKSPGSRRTAHLGLICLTSLAASLVSIGCAKQPEHPWVARDGLIEIETYNRGQLFVKRDHHLGRYDDLMIDGVGFRWTPGQERLDERDEDRIVNMLLNAVPGSEDGSVGIVNAPGPCVLAVNFYLKDLELREPIEKGSSTTGFVSSYGAATIVLELRDSIDQEPLARFVQRRDLGGGREMVRRGASLERLSQVISLALWDMGTQLKKVIPPTTGNAVDGECHDGMARLSLGLR